MSSADRRGERGASRAPKDTYKALLEAVDRVCRTNGAPSIAAVAREVGVTPSLIHNRYPEVASTIRSLAGKQKRDEVAATKEALERERSKCNNLRAENEALLCELRALASVNEALRRRLAIEEAKTAGKVSMLPRAPRV